LEKSSTEQNLQVGVELTFDSFPFNLRLLHGSVSSSFSHPFLAIGNFFRYSLLSDGGAVYSSSLNQVKKSGSYYRARKIANSTESSSWIGIDP